MEPFDLLGIILRAIIGLPAQFIAIYQQNPVQWNLVGLMMAGLIALGWLANRPRRRHRVR
jgi:hypothetical protein